jgi:hypothetical protein
MSTISELIVSRLSTLLSSFLISFTAKIGSVLVGIAIYSSFTSV